MNYWAGNFLGSFCPTKITVPLSKDFEKSGLAISNIASMPIAGGGEPATLSQKSGRSLVLWLMGRASILANWSALVNLGSSQTITPRCRDVFASSNFTRAPAPLRPLAISTAYCRASRSSIMTMVTSYFSPFKRSLSNVRSAGFISLSPVRRMRPRMCAFSLMFSFSRASARSWASAASLFASAASLFASAADFFAFSAVSFRKAVIWCVMALTLLVAAICPNTAAMSTKASDHLRPVLNRSDLIQGSTSTKIAATAVSPATIPQKSAMPSQRGSDDEISAAISSMLRNQGQREEYVSTIFFIIGALALGALLFRGYRQHWR